MFCFVICVKIFFEAQPKLSKPINLTFVHLILWNKIKGATPVLDA